LGYVDAQGNLNIAEFARFLGKKYSTVHKYVKNERNIGGGFIFDLKAKIPALNIEYFSKWDVVTERNREYKICAATAWA
jgi:hypothetical protein